MIVNILSITGFFGVKGFDKKFIESVFRIQNNKSIKHIRVPSPKRRDGAVFHISDPTTFNGSILLD